MAGWSRSASRVPGPMWPLVGSTCFGGPGGFRIAVPLPACPSLGSRILMHYATSRCGISLRRVRGRFKAGRMMQCDAHTWVSCKLLHRRIVAGRPSGVASEGTSSKYVRTAATVLLLCVPYDGCTVALCAGATVRESISECFSRISYYFVVILKYIFN